MKKPRIKRNSKNSYDIEITGNRDPRSPDTTVKVFINELDELVVEIWKTRNCYGYSHTEDRSGFTKLFFN